MKTQISINDFTDYQLTAWYLFKATNCAVIGGQLVYNDNEPITEKELLFIFQDSDCFPL